MVTNELIMRLFQIFENFQTTDVRDVLRNYIYINRKIISVEKNLEVLKPLKGSEAYRDFLLTHLSKTDMDKNKYRYPFKNRELKSIYYLNRGYGGYVIKRGYDILGDIWYWTPSNLLQSIPPGDIKWLGIECNDRQAYAFDFFLSPAIRGNNLAAFFFNSFFHALNKKGINKVYGYFWADNKPALWVHRLVGFSEHEPAFADRFLSFKRIRR
jgi:hypothetical protein